MTARICKIEGCARQVRAQGLCYGHHRAWIKADPTRRVIDSNRAAVLAAMPARHSRIVEATGLHSETVRRILVELRDTGKAHIGYHIPPCSTGQKFAPVFVRGPGVDAKVDLKEKNEQMLRTMRRGHHRRKATRIAEKVPAGAGWAAMLFVKG